MAVAGNVPKTLGEERGRKQGKGWGECEKRQLVVKRRQQMMMGERATGKGWQDNC